MRCAVSWRPFALDPAQHRQELRSRHLSDRLAPDTAEYPGFEPRPQGSQKLGAQFRGLMRHPFFGNCAEGVGARDPFGFSFWPTGRPSPRPAGARRPASREHS